MLGKSIVNKKLHCGNAWLCTTKVKYTFQNNTDRIKDDLAPKGTGIQHKLEVIPGKGKLLKGEKMP